MKIYQVHEFGGEYDDYFDRIVGSYMKRERAEEVRDEKRAEAKRLRAKSDKCNQCPIFNEEHSTIEDFIAAAARYCDEAEIVEDYFGVNCENYFCLWDDPNYCVEEVEVEE